MTISRGLCCDPAAVAVIARLQAAGHETYLVGGCIRDLLLGRQPPDWDIATSAGPSVVQALFPRTVAVGKRFGVVQVLHAGAAYEVAAFRGEADYSDGRRPDTVRPASAQQDVQRRDFTINALLYDPLQARLCDYVGGLQDLETGTLRTVGPAAARLREDRLRLLRAVRFAAMTGFRIAAETEAALRAAAPLIVDVSAERIGSECVRMLTEGYSCTAFTQLARTGLLAAVFPEVTERHGLGRPGVPGEPSGVPPQQICRRLSLLDGVARRSLRIRAQTVELRESGPVLAPLGAGAEPEELSFPAVADLEILAWSAFLLRPNSARCAPTAGEDDSGPSCRQAAEEVSEEGGAILARLRRSRQIREGVKTVLQQCARIGQLSAMRAAAKVRLLRDPLFPISLELHRLDCLSRERDEAAHRCAMDAWLHVRAQPPCSGPLLTGTDLMRMGYKAGPRLGQILRRLEDAQLEGAVGSAAAARAWVERQCPKSDSGTR